MAVPVSQAWTVATYVLKQKLSGPQAYPLVLMLEPLFRCNLACAGCGKIQYPAHILKAELSPEECFKAVEECGAPMVSIPGGEPLLHPKMPEIVAGLVARKKLRLHVYQCAPAQREAAPLYAEQVSFVLPFTLTASVSITISPCAAKVVMTSRWKACELRLPQVSRVTTNTTLFDGADPNSVRAHFDELMAAGVESMMVSPGYTYDKAPDQNHFLGKAKSRRMFRAILSNRKKSWEFNTHPLFSEFLMGKQHFECTPWGMPTFSIFGWQKPCYLLQDGYADTFEELMTTTQMGQLRRLRAEIRSAQLHGSLRSRGPVPSITILAR